jgi:competence protein ComEA
MEAVYLYGDFIMTNSHLIQTNTRIAMAVREFLSMKPQGAIFALLLMLTLGVGLLAGSPPVFAQEQQAVAPAKVATVNINTADAQTLAANLKGVGESRAMEIVRYRESYGPFESVEELTEVKGVGPSTLDRNRSAITLE